jgi:hypothetical protein
MFDIWGGHAPRARDESRGSVRVDIGDWIEPSKRVDPCRFLLVHGDGELTFRMARSRSLRK